MSTRVLDVPDLPEVEQHALQELATQVQETVREFKSDFVRGYVVGYANYLVGGAPLPMNRSPKMEGFLRELRSKVFDLVRDCGLSIKQAPLL